MRQTRCCFEFDGGFVGGGQMATAMMSGLIKGGWPARSILVIEPNAAQHDGLRSLGVEAVVQPGVELGKADVIIWAVKPQVLNQAVRDALPSIGSPLHISIAAGLPLGVLGRWLHSKRVIRVMPNTGALTGDGVTGMVASDGVSREDRTVAERVLASTGYCFWVDSDERLDAVTAVSGSGPAYVFHFLESFQRAAEAQGFEPALARELVLRVAAGAIEQARLGDSFDLLRTRVTSKGGTTEAALRVLNEQATSGAMLDAVDAAYLRAGELARALST
jgi:pyrroline-5-carboxylate reductase